MNKDREIKIKTIGNGFLVEAHDLTMIEQFYLDDLNKIKGLIESTELRDWFSGAARSPLIGEFI